MPYITVEGGPMTQVQKEELVSQLTKTAAEIMNIPSEFFMITIKELQDENIGIGGKMIDQVKKEYRQNQRDC